MKKFILCRTNQQTGAKQYRVRNDANYPYWSLHKEGALRLTKAQTDFSTQFIYHPHEQGLKYEVEEVLDDEKGTS